MGEPPAALKTGGSREANLPGGVDLAPGGSERSDGSLHGEEPRKRAEAPSSESPVSDGGFGGRRLKEERTAERSCGTCAKGVDKLIKGENSGFVLCEFFPRWTWIAQKEPCQFTPPKWEPRSG